eukprot:826069-Rhodomonas_salina.1
MSPSGSCVCPSPPASERPPVGASEKSTRALVSDDLLVHGMSQLHACINDDHMCSSTRQLEGQGTPVELVGAAVKTQAHDLPMPQF